jgi:hypothetical protein
MVGEKYRRAEVASSVNSHDKSCAAVTGTGGCIIAGLTNRTSTGQPFLDTSNNIIIGMNGPGGCFDFMPGINTPSRLTRYPFQQLTLACRDNANNDGLLDFHVAASFSQSNGEYYVILLSSNFSTPRATVKNAAREKFFHVPPHSIM